MSAVEGITCEKPAAFLERSVTVCLYQCKAKLRPYIEARNEH